MQRMRREPQWTPHRTRQTQTAFAADLASFININMEVTVIFHGQLIQKFIIDQIGGMFISWRPPTTPKCRETIY